MPIHQALITDIKASAAVRTWSKIRSGNAMNDNLTLTGLQSNDLIFIVAGSDSTNALSGFSYTGYTTLLAQGSNSIGRYVGFKLYAGSNGSETVQEEVLAEGNADYAFAFVMRSSTADSSYTVTVASSNTGTGNSPTHGNSNVSFAAGDLALLLAWQDDDNASPMNPPSDSTDIEEAVNQGNGSAGAAFKSIQTAGSYSWGAWSTTGTDNTATHIVKVS